MKFIWSYLGRLRRKSNSGAASHSAASPSRSAARRRGRQPQPFIEPLENRVMLSTYTTSSYIPLPTGTAAWVYSGTADGIAATATMTNAGTVTVGPTATTNDQTVTKTASTTSTLNNYYTVGTNGLQLYRQDFNGPNESYVDLYPAPVTLLPGSVSDGQTVSFSEPESGTGTFNAGTSSPVSATWVGTLTGTMTLASAIQTVQIGNANISAIEVTETATFSESNVTTGFSRTGTINNVYWYGLNIGLVKYTTSSTENINGSTTTNTHSSSFTLSTSPLLTSQIAITGNSAAIIAGETAPALANFTDFGNWGAGSGTLSRTYTITNNGSTTLNLIGSPIVKISGADASDFFLTAQPSPTSLAAGVTSSFTINFDPPTSDTGERTATITVNSTDPNTPAFTFEVQGDALAVKNVSPKDVGLQYAITTPGSGAGVKDGDNLSVNYSGYLTTGLLFDSSLNTGRFPFRFTLGAGQVITGWDEGLVGMKVGESRTLIIPAALAYGASGSGSVPANAELVFNITLLAIQPSSVIVVSAGGDIIPSGETKPTVADGTDLGAVNLGQTSTSSFTINENGKLTPRLTGTPNNIQITGADASDFVAIQPTATGSQITFSIEFKPLTLGPLDATVTIQYATSADNYKSKHTYAFAVQGNGSTDLFDPTYYLAQNPTAAAEVAAGTYTSAWAQYWAVGQAQGLKPDPYFDPALYIQQNKDVATEIAANPTLYPSGFAQFVLQGQDQVGYINSNNVFTLGVAPTGTPQVYRTFSYLFDENFYLGQNQDVASAVVAPLTTATATINANAAVTANKFTSGFEHFVLHGVSENREFSPLFDEQIYLDENPDVAAAVQAGVWASGFQQYETDGINEGRQIYPLYNEAYYLAQNPSVATEVANHTIANGFQQFIASGIATAPSLTATGAVAPAPHFSPYYNEADYLNSNADVLAAVKSGAFTSGFEHYVLYGQFEDRTAVLGITPPTAVLNAAPVTTAGAATYDFTVTFTDATAMDVSTLGNGNIEVTGPNSFAQPATFVRVDTSTDGTPRTATYQISAPSGAFSAAGNGVYTVTLETDEVADTQGIFVTAGSLGTFNVNIPQ